MTNANDVLNPSIAILEGDIVTCRQGLTKREYFAAMAMQGLLANPKDRSNGLYSVVEEATAYANNLIEQLNKENP